MFWIIGADPSIPGGNNSNFYAGDFFPTSGEAVFSPDKAAPLAPTGQLIVNFQSPTAGVGANFLDVEAAISSIEVVDGLDGTGNSLGIASLRR